MPASALLVSALALLAIVALLGFVGCSFNPGAISPPDLVSEWPLGDAPGSSTAVDTFGPNPGVYKTATLAENVPSQSPATASPPVLNLGTASLLDSSPAATCVQVDGGYVEVPFSDTLNTPQFTFLVWVLPEWDPAEMVGARKPYRCVLSSREVAATAPRGYTLYAGPNLLDPADLTVYWQAWLGDGTAGAQWQMLLGPPVEFDVTHLAISYDGTTLKLYVNGSNDTDGTPDAQLDTGYAVNTTSSLLIGMGAPEQPAPRFPFKGRLQDVKAYKAALPAVSIDNHVMAGQLTGP